ncbi:MAG: thioredoxin fold domain-containing protein [Acidimicrobiia bacterium]|nr:thioredoxin fold domain-containing protein [Acidimicrobiia bacterium]
MTKPTTTTDARFRFDVLNAEGPVLVDFFADWCPSCQRISPTLDELAADWEGRLKVVKVDVERNPAMTKAHGIQSMPTLVLFEGGEEQARFVNVIRRAAIEDRLAAVGLAA